MADFLANNWGNLASVVGLVFSILAFVFSRRASQAAREARAAILLRTVGEDLNTGDRMARDIVKYVGMERGEMAELKASDLISHTSYLIARWDSQLSESSKNNLLSARGQLLWIHDQVAKGPLSDLDARERAGLTQACQRVSAILSQEYGAAARLIDFKD